MKPENTTTILTVKEAAERWKISYGSLVRMIHANEIPFIQIGKRSYRLREEDFIQAMTAARPKGPVEKLADLSTIIAVVSEITAVVRSTRFFNISIIPHLLSLPYVYIIA